MVARAFRDHPTAIGCAGETASPPCSNRAARFGRLLARLQRFALVSTHSSLTPLTSRAPDRTSEPQSVLAAQWAVRARPSGPLRFGGFH